MFEELNNQGAALLLGSVLFVIQLLLLFIPIFNRLKSRQFDALEIGVLFSFLYCLYSIPLGMEKLYFEAGDHGWAPALYFFVTALGLASFWAGYNAPRPRLRRAIPTFGAVSNAGIGVSTIILASVGIILTTLFFSQMGGLSGYLSIGYGGAQYLAEGGLGYLLVGDDLIMLSLALLWLYGLKTNSAISRILFFVAITPFLYVRIKVGDRGTILALLIMLLSQQHYLVKRFSRKKAITLLLAGYCAGIVFGAARFWIVREDLSLVPHEIVRTFDPEWLVPANVGEFTAPATSLYELIDHPQFFEYQYGYSYFIFLRNFIPEAVIPDRVPTLAQWYLKKFDASLVEKGGGKGFFTAGEAFVNFGYAGPLLQFVIYGVVLRAIYEWFRKQSRNAAAVIVYAACLVWTFPLVRIDLATALRGALIRGIVPALIASAIMVFGKLESPRRMELRLTQSRLVRHRHAIRPQ